MMTRTFEILHVIQPCGRDGRKSSVKCKTEIIQMLNRESFKL